MRVETAADVVVERRIQHCYSANLEFRKFDRCLQNFRCGMDRRLQPSSALLIGRSSQVMKSRLAHPGRSPAIAATAIVLAAGAWFGQSAAKAVPAGTCPGGDTGITLSPGFCATVFADNLGHVRHLAVAADGTVYANTWSGRYYHNDTPPPGGFLLALKDSGGTGHADIVKRFGESVADGAAGGTGLAVYNDAIYAEVNDRIVRYPLRAGEIAPGGKPDTILSGMPLTGDHPMHPFVI